MPTRSWLLAATGRHGAAAASPCTAYTENMSDVTQRADVDDLIRRGAAGDRPPPHQCVFFSLRFGAEHGVVPMAEALRTVLAARGVTAIIINMAAGGDIDTEVFE